jgi:hypothetical protein
MGDSGAKEAVLGPVAWYPLSWKFVETQERGVMLDETGVGF